MSMTIRAMNRLSLLLAAFLLATFSIVAPAHDPASGRSAVRTAAPDRPAARARGLTMSLLDAKNRYDSAGAAAKGARLTEMIEAARNRMDAMAADVDADPEEVM
jgi:hypothetical protein